MFICGQVYSAYIQAWKLPDRYRTNLNFTPVTRFTKEVLEPIEFSKSINRTTEVSPEGFPQSINRSILHNTQKESITQLSCMVIYIHKAYIK